MTNAVSLAQQASTGVSQGFKNRIINGAMVIDQRNAGASVTPTTLYNTFATDRWNTIYSTGSKFSFQQVSTAPAGFTNSLQITSAGAYSVPAGETYYVIQSIEGYNIADLGWGTANAKTITLSFWVRSSLTGTFGGSLTNSSPDRSYPFSYTISAANTWEQKSVTITGDTSGTWLTTNGVGIALRLALAVGSTYSGTAGAWANGIYYSTTGSTNVLGTNGATWYITGVQLEVGSTATSFDYRSYGTELDLCRRYCEVWNDTSANVWLCTTAPNPNNTFYQAGVMSCYPKRVSPSITASSASAFVDIWLGGASTPTSVSFNGQGNKNIYVLVNSSTNQGSYSKNIYLNAGAVTSNYVIVSAEL